MVSDPAGLKTCQATLYTRQLWQKLVNIVYTAFVMSGSPAVWKKKNTASFFCVVWCASQLASCWQYNQCNSGSPWIAILREGAALPLVDTREPQAYIGQLTAKNSK